MHALREITSGRNYSPANRKFQPSDGKRVKTWNRSLHVIIRRGRKLLRTKKRRAQKIHSCCREWHDEQRDSPRNYLPSSLKILRGQRLRSCPSTALAASVRALSISNPLNLHRARGKNAAAAASPRKDLSFTTLLLCLRPGSQSKVGLGRELCFWNALRPRGESLQSTFFYWGTDTHTGCTKSWICSLAVCAVLACML